MACTPMAVARRPGGYAREVGRGDWEVGVWTRERGPEGEVGVVGVLGGCFAGIMWAVLV